MLIVFLISRSQRAADLGIRVAPNSVRRLQRFEWLPSGWMYSSICFCSCRSCSSGPSASRAKLRGLFARIVAVGFKDSLHSPHLFDGLVNLFGCFNHSLILRMPFFTLGRCLPPERTQRRVRGSRCHFSPLLYQTQTLVDLSCWDQTFRLGRLRKHFHFLQGNRNQSRSR